MKAIAYADQVRGADKQEIIATLAELGEDGRKNLEYSLLSAFHLDIFNNRKKKSERLNKMELNVDKLNSHFGTSVKGKGFKAISEIFYLHEFPQFTQVDVLFPVEIWSNIAGFLSPQQRIKMRMVSKQLFHIPLCKESSFIWNTRKMKNTALLNYIRSLPESTIVQLSLSSIPYIVASLGGLSCYTIVDKFKFTVDERNKLLYDNPTPIKVEDSILRRIKINFCSIVRTHNYNVKNKEKFISFIVANEISADSLSREEIISIDK